LSRDPVKWRLEPLLDCAMTSERHDGCLDAWNVSFHKSIDERILVLK
jgi:hypothetical protein